MKNLPPTPIALVPRWPSSIIISIILSVLALTWPWLSFRVEIREVMLDCSRQH